MKVYVQGLSALAHYRCADARFDVEHCSANVRSLEGATSSRAAILDSGIQKLGIGEPSLDRPLEVLVHTGSERSRSKAVSARVWNRPIASTGFRTISKNVYVSSPEFLFLQMATRLDLPELVSLGMELCGTYRRKVEVPVLGTDSTRFVTDYHQLPLSTPRRLRGFLASMKSSPGINKALKALEYVIPNSASPMETALYLLLCLPRRVGGYALPKPELNPPIVLTKAGRRHTLRRQAKPDLFWREAKLDLEFNSDEFHTKDTRAIDSMRRKALESMHVEVIELTTDELLATDLFHATVLRIALRLKKQLRPEGEGDFIHKRSVLRSKLLIEDESLDNVTQNDEGHFSTSSTQGTGEMTPEDGRDLWAEDSSVWSEEVVPDESWSDEPVDDSEEWAVEVSIWEDEDLHVFGAGNREQNLG